MNPTMNTAEHAPAPERAFELRLLGPFLLLAALAAAFLKIASEVFEGEAHAIDLWILQACRVPGQPGTPIGPIWLQEGVRDLTALGSPAVLTLVLLATVGSLVVSRQGRMAWLMLWSTLGGQALALGLKALFARARPDDIYHATVAAGHSFPSSHAMMSAVICLTLAALTARLTRRPAQRWFILLVACGVTMLVGASRVYLGVHWASDVAAGWAMGAAWALLCWMLARRLHMGHEVSGSTDKEARR